MKKAILIRLGAYGDLVMMTPVLRKLKEDGYHVTVNVKKNQSDAALKNNPHIDKFIYHDADFKGDLHAHWRELAKDYDKVINLSGSIEEYLLKREGTPEFNWPMEKRHGFCNLNYYDHTLEGSGYPVKGMNGELYFSPLEIQEAKRFRRKLAGKFVILWSLSGSSFHKTYPYHEYVMNALLNKYDDVVILAVGDALCEVFEPGLRHERIKNHVNKWTMRKSMIMTKFVDCVVGTDTGLVVAAGCFDTPKVIMLSHSSTENLTKYWKNVTPLQAGVECQPCHRLIYTLEACPLEPGLKAPLCMSRLPAKRVFEAIEHYYKEKKHGNAVYREPQSVSGRQDGRDLGQHLQTAAI